MGLIRIGCRMGLIRIAIDSLFGFWCGQSSSVGLTNSTVLCCEFTSVFSANRALPGCMLHEESFSEEEGEAQETFGVDYGR